MQRKAKAGVIPVRQRSQYSCMSTSLMMCLQANGVKCAEDEVNSVMGARPMKGAAWEDAIAAAQHYGMRTHLICPATISQLKEFTDAGTPVMIAWNPEGRPWSHASVVFDVDADQNIKVADPNIPDPDETVRVVSKSDFYGKWYEKWPDYLVRRPAMAVEREISPEGRQMVASKTAASLTPPKHLKRTAPAGHYQVWFSRGGERHPYIQDYPSIQVAMREAKKTTTLGGVEQVVIYDSLGNQFKTVKAAAVNEQLMNRASNLLDRNFSNPGGYSEDDSGRARPPRNPINPRKRRWATRRKVTATPEAIEFLNGNMVPFQKGTGWWLPAHNLGINQPPMGGLNLWSYTILPMFPRKEAYVPAGPDPQTAPAGIVIRPVWVPHVKYAGQTFPDDEGAAEAMAKQARIAPSVAETTKQEFAWVEKTFGITIPSNIKSQFVQQAPKLAARRWGVDRSHTPRTFVPLDGRKPVPMPPSGRPTVRAAVRVANVYMDRLEGRQ